MQACFVCSRDRTMKQNDETHEGGKGKERLDLRSENRWSTDAASLRMMPPIRHHG